jgi:hypothetical protein
MTEDGIIPTPQGPGGLAPLRSGARKTVETAVN